MTTVVPLDAARHRSSPPARRLRRPSVLLCVAAGAAWTAPAGAAEEWRPMRLPAAPAPLTSISAGGPGVPTLVAPLAGTHGLLHSADGGARWQRARLPREDGVGGGGDGVNAAALDPARGRIGYAATSQGVLVTRDGGRHWRRADRGLPDDLADVPGASPVGTLAIAPADPRSAWVGTLEGIYRTTDGGAVWRPARAGLPVSGAPPHRRHDPVLGIALDPRRPRVAYAVTQGVAPVTSRTFDGGRTWTVMRADVAVIAVDPADSSALYGIRRKGELVRSDDEGGTWRLIRRATPVSVALDPARRGRLLVSERGAVLESTDRGRTWSRLPGLPTRYHPGDLRLAVDRRSVVYASSELGAFRLVASGGRWVALRRGALTAQRATIVLAHPRRPRALFAVVAARPGPDRIAASRDGGGSWRILDGGVAARAIRGLTAARSSGAPILAETAGGIFALRRPAGPWQRIAPPPPGEGLTAVPRDRRALVAGASDAIAVSRDGGRSWERRAIPGTPPGGEPARLRVLDDAARTVVAIQRSGGSRACFGFDRLVIGRSLGSAWSEAPVPLERIDALAVDPAHGDHLLAAGAAEVGPFPPCAVDARVAESHDGGATWTTFPSPRLHDLAFDPVVPGRLHALGDGAPLRSDDGGRTWSALPALPAGARAGSLVAGAAPPVVRGREGLLWRLVQAPAGRGSGS